MAVPSTRPETICAALIDTATSLTTGTDLFLGPVKPTSQVGIPRNCVFVYSQLSFRPEVYISGSKDLRNLRIAVFVRSEQDKFAVGQQLARDCWTALQRANITSYTGYVTILMDEGDPQYCGIDDQGNHRFIMNARCLFVG